MRERPIIFTDESVRGILAGTKTQTRRLAKHRGELVPTSVSVVIDRYPNGTLGWFADWRHENGYRRALDPLGRVGDRLWVKEAWRPLNWKLGVADDPEDNMRIVYRADREGHHDGWRSPMYLPRRFSRITLELADVQLERLQCLSERDAFAEQVVAGRIPADEDGPERIGYVYGSDDGRCILYPTPVQAYAKAWDAINGKTTPWSKDPWVWVYTFKRVESA